MVNVLYIKTRQHFLQNDTTSESISTELNVLLDTIEHKLVSHQPLKNKEHFIFNIFDKLRAFSNNDFDLYLNTASSPYEAYKVAALIIQIIKKGTPFSLIRLGDGEGHFLPYQEEFQQFQQKDQEISQKIW